MINYYKAFYFKRYESMRSSLLQTHFATSRVLQKLCVDFRWRELNVANDGPANKASLDRLLRGIFRSVRVGVSLRKYLQWCSALFNFYHVREIFRVFNPDVE